MSSYFEGLLKDARNMYEQKLILSTLSLEEDPFSPDKIDEWSPDIALWSSISFQLLSRHQLLHCKDS